jgi:hypothetical protein
MQKSYFGQSIINHNSLSQLCDDLDITEKMGLAWTSFMDEQWDQLPELRQMADDIKDPNLKIPDYYYAPIHAYKDGMLMPLLLSELGMTVMQFTENKNLRM